MILGLNEVLDPAIADLSPLHQEICDYLLSLSGKRRPTATHAFRTWKMSKSEFDYALAETMTALRNGLRMRGIRRFADLDCN